MTEIEGNKQLKFIEILLIVGGIIGGLGYGSENSSVRLILALFLISSLTYYLYVPDQNMIISLLTSGLFSVLITYPIISLSKPSILGHDIDIIISYILAIVLFIMILKNLQVKSEQKISTNVMIVSVIILIIILFGLNSTIVNG